MRYATKTTYAAKTTTPPPARRAANRKQRADSLSRLMRKLGKGEITHIASCKTPSNRHMNTRSSFYQAAKRARIKISTYVTEDGCVVAVLAEGGAS